jgi:hypothetical protein
VPFYRASYNRGKSSEAGFLYLAPLPPYSHLFDFPVQPNNTLYPSSLTSKPSTPTTPYLLPRVLITSTGTILLALAATSIAFAAQAQRKLNRDITSNIGMSYNSPHDNRPYAHVLGYRPLHILQGSQRCIIAAGSVAIAAAVVGTLLV